MSRQSGGAAVAVQTEQVRLVGADWRLERMRSLVAAGADFGGDWDPETFLLTPRPGGRISGREGCVVPDCEPVTYSV